MANGFFLGGAAEGMLESRKASLAEQTQDQDVALRTRALDINEKQFAAEQGRKDTTRLDENISNTMSIVSEVIKAGVEGGKPPAQIQAAIEPLVKSAQMLAKAAGRDPNAIAAQAQAQLFQPNPIERAAVSGAATATQTVSQEEAERRLLIEAQKRREALGEAAGGGTDVELTRRYKGSKEKAEVENALRDDFVKQGTRFFESRNNYQNILGLPQDVSKFTAGEDIALTFSFLKMLDPGSVASPGEQASVRGTGSLSDQIAVMYNKLLAGESGALGPGVRESLRSRADAIFKQQSTAHNTLINRYEKIAKVQGVNPKAVLVDDVAPPPAPAAAAPTPNQQVESRFSVTPGGTQFRIIP